MGKTVSAYLLFVGEDCYPRGGWDDFKSEHESLEDALAEGRRLAAASDASYKKWPLAPGEERAEHVDWFQIVSAVFDASYVGPGFALISHFHSDNWSDETNTHQWVERRGHHGD